MQELNFFQLSSAGSTEEVTTTLHDDPRIKIEHIASHGQASPEGFWYEQPHDEWVMLVHGEAVIAFADGSQRELRRGDQLFIPRYQPHRVASTTRDALWLAVHILAE